MVRSAIALVALLALALSASAGMVVRDWQFNTPGDNEGWTASSWTVKNLHVAAAVSGSETVLTCENLQNQADPKLYWPSDDIALPAGATSWESLTYRIRQIGTDGVTPVPFDIAGTIAVYAAGGLPNIAPIATATNAEATPPVTVEAQAGEWLLITWDLTAYDGTINGGTRTDPVGGTVADGEILGNFEIDYVTLTAVPEPATLALLACGALALLRKRR